jgi:mannose-1-phosphate guanylyltransferase
MFVWRVDVVRATFRRHAPRIARVAQAAAAGRGRPAARRAYRALRTVSVDVAVLERADDVAVVDGAFGWSDVGSWAAVGDIWGTDASGNAIRGESLLIDCIDTLAYSPHGRLVAAIGVRDLVVVDSPDAVLVCPKSRAQDVRRVVTMLARRRRRTWL